MGLSDIDAYLDQGGFVRWGLWTDSQLGYVVLDAFVFLLHPALLTLLVFWGLQNTYPLHQ